MKLQLIALLSLMALCALAGGPTKLTDINAALAKAKAENKLLFLQFGAEECVNCQALRGMVANGEVVLPEGQFVYADVDSNDGGTVKTFRRRFKVLGMTLPFVVVASPQGVQLAARSGPGTAKDYADLLARAREKRGTSAAK